MSDARSKYNKKPTAKPPAKPTKPPAKPTKPVPAGKVPATKAPSPKGKHDYGSQKANLAEWAKANRKMIEKNGTKKQKEILAKALKVNTPKKKTSSANAAGWQGNRNY